MDLFQDADARTFDKLAAEVPPGSGNLIFLPYLDGERSPIFDANARGVFFGLSSMHRPEHFRRAVLEGVALALRSIVDVYRENTDLQVMRLIGGGAKSALWRAIIADACGLTLERLTTPAGDETSLGIALTAAVGVGMFPDLRAASADDRNQGPAAAGRRAPAGFMTGCFQFLNSSIRQTSRSSGNWRKIGC